MAMEWLHRLWEKTLNVLRHPWHSLVSLLAAVGHFILSLPRYFLIALAGLWRQLSAGADFRYWKSSFASYLLFLFFACCSSRRGSISSTFPALKCRTFNPSISMFTSARASDGRAAKTSRCGSFSITRRKARG